MKNEQEMVDRLKNNKEAFYFQSNEERQFSIDNWKNMQVLCADTWIAKSNELFTSDTTYRLRRDFQLPVERWFYSPVTHQLSSWVTDPVERKELIEVSPDDLAYVKAVIESKDIDLKEYEFRMVKHGETFIGYNGIVSHNFGSKQCVMLFVRKPKPEAKVVQKEYKVELFNKELRVIDFPYGKNQQPLSVAWHYAIDRGMGMEFCFDTPEHVTWHFVPSVPFMEDKPAKCIKVRCFIQE